MNNLPSFRVYLSNGTSYVTSMAKNVTLEDAKRYFIGRIIEDHDEKHQLTFVNVEQVTT